MKIKIQEDGNMDSWMSKTDYKRFCYIHWQTRTWFLASTCDGTVHKLESGCILGKRIIRECYPNLFI